MRVYDETMVAPGDEEVMDLCFGGIMSLSAEVLVCSGVSRILVWGRIEAPCRGEWGAGRGCPPARRGVWGGGCDYLILKWRIFMHISGILTYLFQSSALQRKGEYMYMNTRQRTKGGTYVKLSTVQL